MQIINKLRANFFKSSQAAFNLAKADGKYRPLAEKLISAKNIDAHCNLIKYVNSPRKYKLNINRIDNYEKLLHKISVMNENQKSANFEEVRLPRLELKKNLDSSSGVFNFSITAIKENLI